MKDSSGKDTHNETGVTAIVAPTHWGPFHGTWHGDIVSSAHVLTLACKTVQDLAPGTPWPQMLLLAPPSLCSFFSPLAPPTPTSFLAPSPTLGPTLFHAASKSLIAPLPASQCPPLLPGIIHWLLCLPLHTADCTPGKAHVPPHSSPLYPWRQGQHLASHTLQFWPLNTPQIPTSQGSRILFKKYSMEIGKWNLGTRGRVAAQTNLFIKGAFAQRGENTTLNLWQSICLPRTPLPCCASETLPGLNREIHEFATLTDHQDLKFPTTSLSLVNGHGLHTSISKHWLSAVAKTEQMHLSRWQEGRWRS